MTLHDIGHRHQWMFSFLSIALCVSCSQLTALKVKPYTQYCSLTKSLFLSLSHNWDVKKHECLFASHKNNIVCDIFKLR